MRICCLATQVAEHLIGGMAQQTTHLASDLGALGHAVTVVTTARRDGVDRDTRDGVAFHYLSGTVPGAQTPAWWRASVDAVARLQREAPFDVVWSQSMAAAGVARRGPRALPIVPVIHGTGPEMIVSVANALAHARTRQSLVANARRLARHAVNMVLVDRGLYRRAAAVIAVSRTVAESVRRWYPVARTRVEVVPNGIDPELFRPDAARRAATRARWRFGDDDVVLLTVGILSEQKGVDVAIEALARLRARDPRLALLVVGDGEARAALERLARARGVSGAVRFTGAVPHRETAAFYDAADIFLFPTLRVEAFGVVTVEAMATERPVVVSRIGATPEVVEDGVTGFLVPPGDVEALAARISSLTDDRDGARAMARRARAGVLARWTRQARARRVSEIFESVRRR
jgi:glycosyltransferase involved in cell wall biosynthesis